MVLDAHLASWLKLSLTPGLGNEGLRQLLQAFKSPEAILQASVASLSSYVKPAVAASIVAQSGQASLESVSGWLEDANNQILTLADRDYPQSLLNIPDPPFILYVKGNAALLNAPGLAVVGSRNATPQGMKNAEAFSQSCSASGLCIVSGMAHGIDAAAHRGGLNGAASTIAVVGTGLDKVYPAANRELAHQIASRGVIVSEFPLGTPPLAANFPRRNRIISGLSIGCLVVEASLQSGSLITARLAAEQGRDVFAIPGSIHSPQSKGTHALIKQGAKLVETAQDILEELRIQPTVSTEPDKTAHPILQSMGHESIDLESLSLRSNLTISELSAILLQLELDGSVASLPGGLYQRIA